MFALAVHLLSLIHICQVTGSLAAALNWVGISEAAFNEKLAACSSESERNRLIMETLSGAYDEESACLLYTSRCV